MVALLAPLSVAIVVILILATFVSYSRISGTRDAEMRQDGAVLALLLQHEANEGDSAEALRAHNLPHHLLDGRVQFRILSPNNLVFASDSMPVIGQQIDPGFADMKSGGQYWRVLRLRGGAGIWIDVAEPLSLRRSLTYSMVGSLALPLVFMALAVAMIFGRKVNAALAPLERIADDIRRRDADDLTPLGDSDAPEEVRALIDALNHLLARLQSALIQEREFSDNAAHGLRTPLAVLKLRAQLIERRLGDNPVVKRDMAEFALALDRATDVIDRMLEIVRLSSDDQIKHGFDLSAALGIVFSGFSALLQAKNIELDVAIEPDIFIVGSPGALESAAHNILENAVKFTPVGGRIRVTLGRHGEKVRFAVTDSGPGIRPGEEELIFTRFWRADKSNAGTGLGLALVRRVAILHGGDAGAKMAEGQGLTVFFEIPVAPDASASE